MKRIKILLVLVIAGALAFVLRPSDATAGPVCDVTWTATGSGSWHTAANWSTGMVPGVDDFVCIGDGNDATYTVSANSSVTVDGVRVGNETNTTEQRLVIAVTSSSSNTFTADGALADGGVEIGASGALEMRNDYSSSYASAITVSGTDAQLIVNDGGVLDVVHGNNGGARYISADVVNRGAVNVWHNLALTKAPSTFTNEGSLDVASGMHVAINGTGKVFEQVTGSITMANDHGIQLYGGAKFDFAGGTMPTDLEIYVHTSTLAFTGAPTGTVGSYRLVRSSALEGDVPADHRVIADVDGGASTTVTAPASFTNNGTIVLTNSYSSSYSSTLAGPAGVTFMNSGTLHTVGSYGGNRYLAFDQVVNDGTVDLDYRLHLSRASGVFTNDALIDVASGQWLNIDSADAGTGTAKTFVQRAGEVRMESHHGIQLYNSALFEFSGGTLPPALHVYAKNSALKYVGTPAASTGSFELLGATPSLAGDIPVGHAVTATTDGGYSTTVTVPGNFTNDGTLVLSNRYSYSYGSTLTGPAGTVMTNNGRFQSDVGYGGTRTNNLEMVNHGEIDIDLHLSATKVTNHAAVDIASGQTLTFSGAGEGFIQVAGTVTLASTRNIDILAGALFQFSGGSLTPDQPVYVKSSTLDYVGTPTATTGNFHLLQSPTLRGDVPEGHVVTATMDSSYSTTLTVPESFTNRGTLVLSNHYSYSYGTTLAGASSASPIVLTNEGVVRSAYGQAGSRTINIPVVNNADFLVDIDTAATTVTNNDNVTVGTGFVLSFSGSTEGFLQVAGSLTMTSNHAVQLRAGAVFEFTGGMLPSDHFVYVRNSTLKYPGPLVGTTGAFELLEAPTLIGDIPAGHLVVATMDSSYSTTLSVPASFVNDGTLLLSNRYSYSYGSSISGPAGTVLTNNGELRMDYGQTGGRELSLEVVNNGDLFVDVSTSATKVTNNAQMTIASGQLMRFDGSAESFHQVAGSVTMSSDHALQFRSGATLEFTDGLMTPEFVAYVYSSTLRFIGSPALSSGSYEVLNASTLVGDVPVGHHVTATIDSSYSTVVTVPASFTNNGRLTLSNRYSYSYSSSLSGPGAPAVLTNNGTIVADYAYSGGRSITGIDLDNQGTLDVSIDLTLSGLTNFASGSLNGGTFLLGSNLRFPGASITTNASTVHLHYYGAILDSSTGADGLSALDTNTGTLLLGTSRYFAVPAFSNTGTVELQDGATLDPSGDYTQSGAAARTNLTGVGSHLDVSGATAQIQGGAVAGIGTISGTVVVGTGAALVPGASPGTLTFNGDLTLGAGAELIVEIEGETAGTGYDQVVVSGNATIDPAALLDITSTQVPTPSSTYDLVVGATMTGGFTLANTTGWDVGTNGMYYVPSSNVTTALLTAHQRSATVARDAPAFAEGAGTASFTITLSHVPEVATMVEYSTAEALGTHRHATAAVDYTVVDGSAVSFAAGETTKVVTVDILQDVIDEYDTEDFSVFIDNPSGTAIIGAASTDTVAITDDDAAPVASVELDAPVTEGNSGLTIADYTATITGASEKNVILDWATVDGTATATGDYRADSGRFPFPVGTSSLPISLEVMTDLLNEADETFSVVLTSPDDTTTVSASDGEAVTTILNDDDVPMLAITGGRTVTEGNSDVTTMSLPVYLSAPSGRTVTVDYASTGGTATSGTDFTAVSGTLTFASGVTSQIITVDVIGDTLDESDEAFTVSLANAANAALDPLSVTAVGTITDDDDTPLPEASITSAASITEGTSSTDKTATFTVNLSAVSTKTVTVGWATQTGTAHSPADFTSASGTLTFDPGVTSKTVGIKIKGDALDEFNETFSVVLNSPSNATLSTTALTRSMTITDDDPVPTVSVAGPAPLAEGSSTTTASFTVALSAVSGKSISVPYATSDGTATSADFTAASGTLTFAAGEASKVVNVTVLGNVLDEDDESFALTLSTPTNATLGTSSASATIVDDDAAPTVSIAVTSGAEGSGAVTATATLSAVSAKTVSVGYATADGSAVAPEDYVAASSAFSFAPGETTKSVAVAIANDSRDEIDETFWLDLVSPVNSTIATGSAMSTITDDDATPAIGLTGPTAVTEGNAGTTPAVFTLTLSAPSGQSVSVDVATSDGSAVQPNDYQAVATKVTFAPGQTAASVPVPVVGDLLDETDETFSLTVSNPVGATLGAVTLASATITDDDAAPAVTIGDAKAVLEGNSGTTNASFKVSLSAPSGQPVSVAWATADDTATAGEDYTAASGTVSFAAGELTKTVNVPVVGDTTDESDERFNVVLSSPVGAVLGAPGEEWGTGTILDDDGPPSLSISDASPTIEDNAGTTNATFTVTLAPATKKRVTVGYATGELSADSGVDYQAVTGTLVFSSGQTSKTITVPVIGDLLDEPDESFMVELLSPSNADLGTSVAVGMISDDDAAPTVSVADTAPVNEGDAGSTNAVFTISLSGPSGRMTSVAYTTADGTAVAPGDFTAASGTVTFAAGETSKTVAVAVLGDTIDESDEQFSLNLSTPLHLTIGAGTGTATVVDDDESSTDTTPPAAPTSLSGSVDRTDPVGIVLDWPNSPEADVAGYDVWRWNDATSVYEKITASPLTASSYRDPVTPPTEGGFNRTYYVTVVDTSGNVSSQSPVDDVWVADESAPAVPAGISAEVVDTDVRLSWTANTESDISHYDVYRSDDGGSTWNFLTWVSSAFYTDMTTNPGATYDYALTAWDTSSNDSARSASVSVVVPATGLTTTRVENTDVSVTYSGSWSLLSPSAASGGSLHATNSVGAEAEMAFTGTGVRLVSRTGPNHGVARVRIVDSGGVDLVDANVDLYSSSYAQQVPVFEHLTLAAGDYTVVVERTGTKSLSNTTTSATINIDAIEFMSGTDTTPPAAPASLSGSLDRVDPAGVLLDWPDSPEADVAGYDVWRYNDSTSVFDKITASPVTVSSYRDPVVLPTEGGFPRWYHVTAVDASGNVSDPSGEAFVWVADESAPAAPTGLAASVVDGDVHLSWTANTESDISYYDVYRSEHGDSAWDYVGYSYSAGYTDATSAAGVAYDYAVTAWDSSSNESARSASASATVPASVSTTRVENTDASITYTGSWNLLSASAASDGSLHATNSVGAEAELEFSGTGVRLVSRTGPNHGIARVRIVDSGGVDLVDASVDLYSSSYAQQVPVFEHLTLAAGDYTVVVERTGTKSPSNTTTSATINIDAIEFMSGTDTTPPAAPTSLLGTVDRTDPAVVELDWRDSPEPDVAGYAVWRWNDSTSVFDKITTGLVTVSSYRDPVVLPTEGGFARWYHVTAVDSSGNVSDPSGEAYVWVDDLSAPAAPSGLAPSVVDGDVHLSWSANTESDLYYYDISRSEDDGVTWVQVGYSYAGSASFVDVWADPGATYGYKVAAMDTAYNESPRSEAAWVTLPAVEVTTTRVENTDVSVTYSGSWSLLSPSAASGGSLHATNSVGAEAEMAFTGTGVRLVSRTGPNHGVARVRIVDSGGVDVVDANVDLYSSSYAQQVPVFEDLTLPAGSFTVVVEWTGTKNPSNTTTSATINIDAIEILG